MDAKQQQRATPAPAALDNGDILRRIFGFLDVPADLVRSALVSKRWLAAASDPAFLRDFAVRCPRRLLGFIAVFGPDPLGDEHSSEDGDAAAAAASDEEEMIHGGDGDEEMAIGGGDDDGVFSRFVPLPGLPTNLARAARLVAAAFNAGGPPGDLARACSNGHVLVVPGAPVDGAYSVRRPLRLTASGVVHLPAPPQAEDDTNDDEERFVAEFLLVRGRNQPGGDDDLSCCHGACVLTAVQDMEGVIDAAFVVHVLQDGGAWVTHTSPPMQVEKPVDTYVSPYSLVVGSRLYMLIITGYIAVFDIVAATFSLHKLPDGVSSGDGGVLDHRLARAGDTGLYIVHARGTELRFLRHLQGMEDARGVWEWELVDTVILGGVLSVLGVEIYAVGDDAAFLFLMVGDNIGLFLLDVKSMKVKMVLQTSPTDDGHLYRVLPFMMPWPPVFPPALDEGNVN